MKTILITGSSGFIGRAVARKLFPGNKIILFDKNVSFQNTNGQITIPGDITNTDLINSVCFDYVPDVVIHCAGIAHQKLSKPLDKKVYDHVNSVAANNVAAAAAKANPDVHFIFLSSTTVYGENYKGNKVTEKDPCSVTSDYARSKFEAERGLKACFNRNVINRLDILRLAPVYDVQWNRNLEKRVLGPLKIFYIRFGSGNQRMSVLARQNLADFISHQIEYNSLKRFCNVINVTDKTPVTFNQLIEVLQKFEKKPSKKVLKVPLACVWMLTRGAGVLAKGRREWIYSFYDKLANDLVFDNERMLHTGFSPQYSLKSVFC